MPVPRRQIHLLVQDAAGTVPVTKSVQREQHPNTIRRCANHDCRCLLARDQIDHYCSPCQRRMTRMPQRLGDYLEENPQHEQPNEGPRKRGPSSS